MGTEFNVNKLLSNIVILVKDRGLKFGEIESTVGISTGYLNRMIRKGSDANPSMEIVWKLANYFDLSVETLVDGDASNPYDNIRLITAIAKFCKQNTLSGQMEWTPISINEINNEMNKDVPSLPVIGFVKKCITKEEPYGDLIPDGVSLHSAGKFGVCSPELIHAKLYATATGYKGLFTKDNYFHIYQLGGVFHNAQTQNGQNDPFFEVFYDIWLEDTNEEGPKRFHYVCTTRGADLQLRESVNDLYNTVNTARTDVRLDYRVKQLFSKVLSDNEGLTAQ